MTAGRVVGLSFDGGEIRAVEVVGSSNGPFSVERAGSIAVPDGSIENGRIVNAEALSTALISLWERIGFRSTRVRLSIDGRLAVLRRSELPALTENDLRQAASYDIADLINYPIEEAVFDVAVLDRFERNDQDWVSTLVVSVPETVLTEFRSLLSDAGLETVDTEFVADAIGSALLVDTPPTKHTQEVSDDAEAQATTASLSVIVDVEDTVTSVFVRDAGGTLFSRSISAGVATTSLSLAEELEAELALLVDDDSHGSQEVRPAAGVATVVEGIRRTISYFRDDLDSRRVEAITLTGSRSRAAGLVPALEDATGLRVERAQPAIDWDNEVIGFAGFEVALGAALVGGRRYAPTRRLRLVSDSTRRSTVRRRGLVVATIVVGLLSLVAAADGWSRRSDAHYLEQEATRAEATTDEMFLKLENFSASEDEQLLLEVGEQRISDLKSQRVRYLHVLGAMAEAMPLASQLVSIEVQRGEADEPLIGVNNGRQVGVVTFIGLADDLSTVGDWIDSANDGPFIDNVWLEQSVYGTIGDSEIEAFFFVIDGVITNAASTETAKP
jgi:type IV pilus assembly protein PilM